MQRLLLLVFFGMSFSALNARDGKKNKLSPAMVRVVADQDVHDYPLVNRPVDVVLAALSLKDLPTSVFVKKQLERNQEVRTAKKSSPLSSVSRSSSVPVVLDHASCDGECGFRSESAPCVLISSATQENPSFVAVAKGQTRCKVAENSIIAVIMDLVARMITSGMPISPAEIESEIIQLAIENKDSEKLQQEYSNFFDNLYAEFLEFYLKS